MKFKNIGIYIAEIVTGFVGSWYFIIIYVSIMGIYVIFHEIKIILFDNDYVKFQLILAAFTVSQGSLLLIASNKQAKMDRDKWNHDHAEANSKILELTTQMDKIEDSIDQLLEENDNDQANGELNKDSRD